MNKLLWTCFGVSALFMLASFILPPTGVIDNSVIMSVGELGFLATLSVVCKAIDNGYDAKMSKGDKTLELKN
jgi:hypothetical protein